MSDLSKIEELYKRIDELEEIVKELHPTHAYFNPKPIEPECVSTLTDDEIAAIEDKAKLQDARHPHGHQNEERCRCYRPNGAARYRYPRKAKDHYPAIGKRGCRAAYRRCGYHRRRHPRMVGCQ